MTKVKIYYRSSVVWNLILFVIFSFVFLYLQALSLGAETITNEDNLIEFSKSNMGIIFLYLTTILSLYVFSPIAKVFYFLSVSLTVFLTIMNLFDEFSKLMILILFFYILFSFYLYYFFNQDYNESYYNPIFAKDSLFEPMCKKIGVEVFQGDKLLGTGYLTNWSREGFFVFLSDWQKISGVCDIRILFQENIFKTRAKMVTLSRDENGVGFKVLGTKKDSNELDWFQFEEIISDLGYEPELLR